METTRRALIYANGEVKDLWAASRIVRSGDFVIAADGGLHLCEEMKLAPDLLIGDLDSVSAEDVDRMMSAGVAVKRFPAEKNETDLELALSAAVDAGYDVIRVIGALGGRLDQTLGNLFLLMLPELKNCDVRFDDGLEEVLLLNSEAAQPSDADTASNQGKTSIRIQGRTGDVISLLPLNGAVTGIRTEGLYYPLNEETLYPEHTRGISNVMRADTATISIENGTLLCIHSRQSSV